VAHNKRRGRETTVITIPTPTAQPPKLPYSRLPPLHPSAADPQGNRPLRDNLARNVIAFPPTVKTTGNTNPNPLPRRAEGSQ